MYNNIMYVKNISIIQRNQSFGISYGGPIVKMYSLKEGDSK